MKLRRIIYFVLFIGILASFSMVYFYVKQKAFSENYKEFLNAMYNIENAQENLNYLILQNSIYTYYNHDAIAQKQQEIKDSFEALEESKILLDGHYTTITLSLKALQSQIQESDAKIEKYLQLNAAVKNSLLFLTRHLDNAAETLKKNSCSQECKDIFLNANLILKHYNNATRMQDLDYIKESNLILFATPTEQKNIDFVKKFNLHATFLSKEYPLYINITKSIFNSQTNHTLQQIRADFTILTLKDFKALNAFSLILFAVLILFLATISFLFLIHLRENKKLQETKESLEYSLVYDQLTELFNRISLEKKLREISKPHILLLNIDSFKNINDIYGNAFGNVLLKKLARFLEIKLAHIENIGIYRLGADEFGVLFTDTQNAKILSIAHYLEKEITSHSFLFGEVDIHITVSISSNSIEPILENADLALKLIKKDVTKRVIEYDDSLNLKKSVQENLKMLETIKAAILDDRILPFFQPIVNLQTLKIEKYEALVRLKLENGRYLTPYKFLDTARKSYLYEEITRIMIEKSMRVAKEYPAYRFSINIAMRDILNDTLTNTLFQMFEEEKEVASRIDIELLESEDLHDIEKAQVFIQRAHSFGSKILLDDFGSGYSNFSYFAHLDVDIIKIDGSIVSEITTDNKKLHMLRSIHNFSHGMDIINIAEFVETQETALLLKEVGVEYAQGYYFGHPLPVPLEHAEIIFS
ncbi:MAG: EAL domain-containing protein [Sulfurimonas sp.]|nr:EAL domain-containing protein [Sulfurimonas sp.]